MVPTTLLNACSRLPADWGSAELTFASTADSRTIGVTWPIRDPEIATPSAQATISTATALSMAPPTASTARAGCQVIFSRSRAPAYWNSACPSDAARITMNRAPRETQIDGSAWPSAIGASQMPSSPPRSSPAVAKAPVTNPCQ